MKLEFSRPNWFYSSIKKIASTRPVAWFLSKTDHHLDRAVMKLSKNRTSLTTLMTGLPVLYVTTIGAKSGQPRSVPLIGIPEGEEILFIASNWGQSFHPSWYLNMKAHPQVTVEYRGKVEQYVAEEVEEADRAACWQKAVRIYPGYEAYKARAGDRVIPIIRLTPRAG